KQGSFQNLSVTEFGSKEEITIRFLGSNDSLGSDIGEHISTLLFDLSLEEKFEYDFNIDDEFLLSVREKFFENIDILKKDKVIKS
ncbi:hypothetical protein VWM68_11265, partial [Campylobacter coli]